ncbi:MAG: phosphatase PAP2 family protein [Tepidiformaceae bacterium]
MAVRLGTASSPWGVGALARSAVLYAVEMAFFLSFLFMYFILRGLPTDRVEEATANARHIIAIERRLGVFAEVGWQQAAHPNPDLVSLANFTYLYLHLPLLLVMGFLFFHADIRKYRVLRNAMLLSGLIGVAFYLFAPVTPPRLMAAAGYDLGFVDTLDTVRRTRPGPLANDYAAIPSYHFGWVALAACGVWWCWKAPLLRGLAVAFTALMWWAIVVTGNHYFLDMALGALLVAFSFVIAYRWERWVERRPASSRRWLFRLNDHRLPF